jgi:hypothetical protein
LFDPCVGFVIGIRNKILAVQTTLLELSNPTIGLVEFLICTRIPTSQIDIPKIFTLLSETWNSVMLVSRPIERPNIGLLYIHIFLLLRLMKLTWNLERNPIPASA